MADEAKPKAKILSTKFGAAMVGGWLPIVDQIAKMEINPTALWILAISMWVYIGVEGALDALRILTGRGGPKPNGG